MQQHTKNFCEHYDLGEQSIMKCQHCNQDIVVDVHHIEPRSQGGSDEIDNLIGLCRKDHNKAHAGEITKEEMKKDIAPYLTNDEVYVPDYY